MGTSNTSPHAPAHSAALGTPAQMMASSASTHTAKEDLDCFIPIEARPDVALRLAKAVWSKVERS